MGIKMASLFALLVVLALCKAYPMVSGGKRYSQMAWAPYPIYYQPRATRPYATYYDSYVPDISDLYYTQDPYFKLRTYQIPPQYYSPNQFDYEEEEENDDEDLTSYGALPDAWYNSPNGDANAMFLQNLMLSQMYKDLAPEKPPRYYPTTYMNMGGEDDEPYLYREPIREAYATPAPKENKDVQDLKSLVDTGKQRRKTNEGSRKSLEENRWVNKRSSTTEPPLQDNRISENVQEEMTSRLSNSGRQAFHQRSYQPSAYDAIKKLLIQQNNHDDRQLQKRSYVLNEESLVDQLGKLKNSS